MNKIKIMKSLVLLSILLFMVNIAYAVRLPSSSEKNWATSPIYGLEKWLLESHTANGTLKADMNLSANDFNITNNLIVLGNIKGEIPNSFKDLNWSKLYIAEANTRYVLTNFTSNYDDRNDRFGNINFTSRLNLEGDIIRVGNLSQVVSANEKNPSNATIQIGTSQVTDLASFVVNNERNPSNATIRITEGQISDLQNYLTSTINKNIVINGVRSNNITGEEQFLGISGSLTGIGDGSNNAKTWVIKASATRPAGSNTINGDFDDALFKGSITNKATSNEANYIMRGLNIGATNRDGGNVNKLHGGHFSATQKGSSNVVTDLWGLSIKVEADSPNTAPTNVIGLNVEYDMVAPTGTPTLSAGVRVNQNSDYYSAYPTAGFMVDNGASAMKWQYGLYNDDNTILTAEVRLSTGVLVMSGSGSPEGVKTAPVGSLYTRTDGGAGTTLYVKETGTGNTGWVAK